MTAFNKVDIPSVPDAASWLMRARAMENATIARHHDQSTSRKLALEHSRVGSGFVRVGQPSEVAKMVLFLASDDSSYMLGENLLVDGGMATV